MWDKATRLDIVFGSTGTTSTKLIDFMDEVDQRILDQPPPSDHDFSSSSDSDDDEGELIIRTSSSSAIISNSGTAVLTEEDRSTHFLAIKVTNQEVAARLQQVQQAIVDHEEILCDCCMNPGLFHITLGMYRIQDIAGIQAAVNLMEEMQERVSLILQDRDTSLTVKNLNQFGHRVVYAEVHPRDPQLFNDLVTFVRQQFDNLAEHGVASTNSFSFVPHVTLVKVSRQIARARHSQFIDEAYYKPMAGEMFGEQRLDNLNLCIIEASTRFDGFYTTLADFTL